MSTPPRIVIADRGDSGRRLDLMLRRHITDVDTASRTRIQAWIENGQVSVNGAPVCRVAARLACGDVVAVGLPDVASRPAPAAEDVPLNILYEDEHMLALDKPAGAVVHPGYRHQTGTLLNALLWRARAWPPERRPSLVGRLDKGTSGIVVVAKSARAHAALQHAIAADRGQKDYLAVVYAFVKKSRGDIDLRLAHDQRNRRRIVAAETGGAPSLTRFERLARVATPHPGLSLLRCRLVTGRTHQIRVHLAAQGWPLVGDPVYGLSVGPQAADSHLDTTLRGFSRQALHSWRLAFIHPITFERVFIEAPVPPDLKELLTASGLWRL